MFYNSFFDSISERIKHDNVKNKNSIRYVNSLSMIE